MEIIQTKPELDSYSVSMWYNDTLELTDICTLVAAKSVNEGFLGGVDAEKAEDKIEVPVEEHEFCLLDMDRGSLQQLPCQQSSATAAAADSINTTQYMSSLHAEHQETRCHACGLDNCPTVVDGGLYTKCAMESVHSYSSERGSSEVEEGQHYFRTGCEVPHGCQETVHSEMQYSGPINRPFQCHICGKRFMQSGVLKTHSLIHKGERPFTCDVCKKQFLLAWHLRRHALTHSGVKPYACDLCGKEFNQSSNLRRHFPTHSRDKVRRNGQTLDYS